MEFTIAASFFTGRVISPGFSTSAFIEHLIPKSRFVVVSTAVSPSAFISTLFNTGIDGFELTTFVTWRKPVAKCSLLILNFIELLSLL